LRRKIVEKKFAASSHQVWSNHQVLFFWNILFGLVKKQPHPTATAAAIAHPCHAKNLDAARFLLEVAAVSKPYL
jgi:hypothetical protein